MIVNLNVSKLNIILYCRGRRSAEARACDCNASVVGSITLGRMNNHFLILSFLRFDRFDTKAKSDALTSAKRSVSTLGSLCLSCCVRDTT